VTSALNFVTCTGRVDAVPADLPRLHILIPKGSYLGQVRGIGCRRWRTVTGNCRSAQSALSRAVSAMGKRDKRARALFIDSSPYYEPHVAMEAHRR